MDFVGNLSLSGLQQGKSFTNRSRIAMV